MDEKLKQAFEVYHKCLNESIDWEAVENTTVSEECDRRIEKMIRRKTRIYPRFLNTAVKRVACLLVVLFLSATVTTFSVEALREGFISFVVELFDGGTSIQFPGETNVLTPRTPGYIPDGFQLTSKTESVHAHLYRYEGPHYRSFQFSQHPKGTNITVYTKHSDYRTIALADGQEGIIFENSGETFLIFNDADQMYAIIGTLSEAEAIKIANSLFETR